MLYAQNSKNGSRSREDFGFLKEEMEANINWKAVPSIKGNMKESVKSGARNDDKGPQQLECRQEVR